MDKVISARIDASAAAEMDRVTRRAGITKKRFLEEAIRLRARQLDESSGRDVWDDTLGAWSRDEPAEATVVTARRAFERSMSRHRRAGED